MTSLEERVARAMCDGNWDAKNFNETPSGEEPEDLRNYWRDKARAAIAVCAEEMARIADEQADEYNIGEGWFTGKSIAAAIRSMGERG